MTGREVHPHADDVVGTGAAEQLDEIDETLIELLRHDGRLSYAELGERVGLSAGGARSRVLRLQERDVIRVVAITNPVRLGYARSAVLCIEVEHDALAVADALGALPDVTWVVLGGGRFDLLVEVRAVDDLALFALVNRAIRPIAGVRRVETFTCYAVHTDRHTSTTLR